MNSVIREVLRRRIEELKDTIKMNMAEMDILAAAMGDEPVNGANDREPLEPASTPTKRRVRTMTASERAEVSKRMKRYWRAKRREAKG